MLTGIASGTRIATKAKECRGKELFALRTPQGMLVEYNDIGDLAQPLSDEPAFKRGLATRDQVLSEIARIVGHPARTPTKANGGR